jgi:hypothetical protein
MFQSTCGDKQSLHQLDVKNVFLRSDLLELYMEILPGFGTNQTVGKICKLKISLYELAISSNLV